MSPIPTVIEPAKRFAQWRRPVRDTEVTLVWNDGDMVKRNRFGEVERRKVIPEANVESDPHMKAFFEALDGLTPKQAAVVLANLDEGISL